MASNTPFLILTTKISSTKSPSLYSLINFFFVIFAIKKYSDSKADSQSATKADPGEENIDPNQALRIITDYVNKNFEDVGLNFAKEALKIHFGESEKRNIKGMALPEEEKILKEEGIPFLKLPVLKRLDN